MLRLKQDLPTSIVLQKQSFLPLKRVNIEGTVPSFAAAVTIAQVFRNDENQSTESVYCFSTDEQAAIDLFIARIDDCETIVQLKEK
ncbi:unnamed protein product [Rotaria sordida]|uniref:VIT domain-containing protein n=1 Tax=Rotaria sordida TaxID=392033 RepID=A0A814WN27_9BILA|nr:unnamed protein product [Rotaria sordida]